jgi:integrase
VERYMTRFKLKYIHAYIDRHGHARHYFRRRGSPKVSLPGLPGSSEFMAAYQAALDGIQKPQKRAVRPIAPRGSIEALVTDYLASAGFLGLKRPSQRAYRGILDPFRAEHGHRLVKDLSRDIVKKLFASKAATPSGANNFLAVLRVLMEFAVDEGYRDDNPVAGIKRIRIRSGGYHPWTDEEIERFEQHWPIGTKARLAFALHLYTGQRRSDVIRMTWRDIVTREEVMPADTNARTNSDTSPRRQLALSGGAIQIKQAKTGKRLRIPIHPNLAAALDAAPREHIAILTTQYGRPFTTDGYGGWFAKMVRRAGLPKECASHGLRKAAARRLAEAGCTAHEIAAITGHASLSEVERYTRDASQDRLGETAIGKLK